jgi:hypothetical protein
VEIQEKKSNVLVILIDNQRYFELSRNYNQIVQIPRIDKRSTQAVNFTEFIDTKEGLSWGANFVHVS